ncbi:MAG: gamma-glutamyltransferase [Bacteroidetes bacterium]|nr:gamma-glutamyltransferase [Bacteroidota bacterium]
MKHKLILPILLIAAACSTPEKPEKSTGLVTTSAMVVSAHPEASRVGKEILKKGGNAIDASIAVQFALAVVFPAAGNIGGGGFMVARFADGSVDALDYREKAPDAASPNMYIGETGEPMVEKSIRGHLACGVPGTVAGLADAHHKYGKLSWSELVQPAIDLAIKGVVLTEREASGLRNIQEDLKKYNTTIPDHLISENWKKGDILFQEELGHTLERIRDGGRAGFYDGKTAQDIVAEMKSGGGLITLQDLKNYTAVWRKPVRFDYKDYNVISMPPPSSGGVLLAQLLNAAADFPEKNWKPNGLESSHYIIEAERRAYADRAAYLGDPDFISIPVEQLIRKDYMKKRMADVDPEKATPSAEVGAGVIPAESDQTTHLSIVDAQGNAVAVTTTLNAGYGSMVVVAGSGFLLNDEMDDFSVKPGVPNIYGAIGGEANKIEPGKRMLSSMTPTIVEKDKKLFMVLGTPGGTTIITTVFQTILNVVEHGMSMQEAVTAKRFHMQWMPDVVGHEPGAFSASDSTMLLKKGHKLTLRKSIGRMDAIRILKDGRLEGGADPRGDDTADGY